MATPPRRPTARAPAPAMAVGMAPALDEGAAAAEEVAAAEAEEVAAAEAELEEVAAAALLLLITAEEDDTGAMVALLEPLEADEDPVVVTTPVVAIPDVAAEAFKHEVVVPAWMTKGEEYWIEPWESVILKVMLVPGAKLTVQTKGDASTLDAMNSRAGADTSPPGRAERMYGGVPPLKAREAGWHTIAAAGVLIVSCAETATAAMRANKVDLNIVRLWVVRCVGTSR